MGPKAVAKNQTVQSITRAANILKLLSTGETHSITSISLELKLSKGTVHRLLETLEASNFVVQDPVNRRYGLGQFIVSLASNFMISHQTLILRCVDEMNHLRDVSGETICLSIPIGSKRFVLEELPSNQNIKFTVGKGFAVPLHLGCTGKVLLAELPESESDAVIDSLDAALNEGESPLDKQALKQEVRSTREQGFAMSFGEVMSDAAGISVPIRGYICPSCISIFGPEYRFKRIMQVLPELRKSAGRISEALSKRTT